MIQWAPDVLAMYCTGYFTRNWYGVGSPLQSGLQRQCVCCNRGSTHTVLTAVLRLNRLGDYSSHRRIATSGFIAAVVLRQWPSHFLVTPDPVTNPDASSRQSLLQRCTNMDHQFHILRGSASTADDIDAVAMLPARFSVLSNVALQLDA